MKTDHKTKIEWTHVPGYTGASWNPIRAEYEGKKGWFCTKVSPGCAHCYAESVNLRLGNGLKYIPANTALPRIFLHGLEKPRQTKKPTAWFVNSMTDLFHPLHSFDTISDIVAEMVHNPRHIFQVLTKHPDRAADYIRERGAAICAPHIWLGTTIEAGAYLDRLDTLRSVYPRPWVSYEPAVGPIDWSQSATRPWWIVVGGESGGSARRMDPEWIRSTVAWGRDNGVPVFVKQLGKGLAAELGLQHAKGGDWEEWPLAFKVRQWPNGLGTLASVFDKGENIDELAKCGRWEDCGGNCGVVYE